MMCQKGKTIIIGTSSLGYPVSDYYYSLAKSFVKNGYNIIFILDGKLNKLPPDITGITFYSWPNKRPTKIKDFIFAFKLFIKEKPILCLSNFGSTNVLIICSWLTRIKTRVNYVHTTISQLKIDSNKKYFLSAFLFFRKKIIYSLCTNLFTNSTGNKNDICENYKIKKKKILVFPLLLKKSSLSYLNYKSRNKELLIVGRLHPSKGHESLIRQFKICLDKGLDLKLRIVGSGNLELLLKKLVFELNIEKNVVFHKEISNKLINYEFNQSLIHISSSIEEAYGLVNIESLREGTPIISSKTFGAKDILKEGFNGEYFDHNNEFSLFYSISKILMNWDRYSSNSIISFNEQYLVDINIDLHKNKILNLINNN